MGIRRWFESPTRLGHTHERWTSTTPGHVRGRCPAWPTTPSQPRARRRWSSCATAAPMPLSDDMYLPVRARGGRGRRPARAAGDRRFRESSAAPARRGRGRASADESGQPEAARPLGDGSPAVEVDGTAPRGVPHPVAQVGDVLADAGRLGLARVRHPHLDPVARALGEPRAGEADERILLPTFRIPTLIHTRSANSKWLSELSHRHPLWVHPSKTPRLSASRSGRLGAGHHPHRPLRDRRLAHRGDPTRRGGRVAPHGPLAPRRQQRRLMGRVATPTSPTTASVWRLRRRGHPAESRQRRSTTPSASGGATPACTRI